MKTKNIIKYARSRKQDYQLASDEYRTYLDTHILVFVITFLFVTLIFYIFFSAQNYSMLDLWKQYFSKSISQEIQSIAKSKINFYFFVAGISASLASCYLVKPIQRQSIKNFNANRLIFDETATKQFMQNEPEPKLFKIKNDFYLSNRALETGFLITGQQGSGKSVTLDLFHENNINAGSYSISHDPKGDLTQKYLSAGESIAILAPWLNETKAIDFGKLCYNTDKNRQSSFIDLVIISFHGKAPESGDTYWYDTSFAIYKAIFLRMCSIYKDNWQENNICEDFFSRTTTKDFNELKEFYAPIGNLIKADDDSSQMVSAIIGSCIPTIIKFYTLASFWKNEKNRLDIKAFLYRKTKYKHIIIRNDATYETIASCVVACFVNIATSILLDSEYLNFSKTLKNNEFRFLLDEFNSFAKFIDIPKFNGLNDLGRQAGIRLAICLQRRSQALHFTKNQGLADDFLATFPNLIICRMAQSDIQAIEKILGSYKVNEYVQSSSFNAQGQSLTEKLQEKDIVNDVNILQNTLGPIPKIGVKVCFKTVQNPIFAVITIPFKNIFAEEIIKERKLKAKEEGKKFRTYKFSNTQKITDVETIAKILKTVDTEINEKTPEEDIKKSILELDTILTKGETAKAENSLLKEVDELGELGKDVLTSIAEPSHLLSTVQTLVEIEEALNPATKNNDTIDDNFKKLLGRK